MASTKRLGLGSFRASKRDGYSPLTQPDRNMSSPKLLPGRIRSWRGKDQSALVTDNSPQFAPRVLIGAFSGKGPNSFGRRNFRNGFMLPKGAIQSCT
jgi:hypothetical protein